MYITHCTEGVYLIHQLTYALNKIHLEASIELLHVSVPGFHRQGAIQNKGVQG